MPEHRAGWGGGGAWEGDHLGCWSPTGPHCGAGADRTEGRKPCSVHDIKHLLIYIYCLL